MQGARPALLKLICPKRPLPCRLAMTPMHSPTRITFENNGKISPRLDRENLSSGASSGCCLTNANSAQLSGVTYVPTWSGTIYVALVINFFARQIVG